MFRKKAQKCFLHGHVDGGVEAMVQKEFIRDFRPGFLF
jgi:hypothetical protein